MTVPQHSPDRPASRSPRRLAGAAAATGLLLALAVPALAGTAYADEPSAQPKRASSAKPAEPSAAPASPVKRAGEGKQQADPSARPSASPPSTAQPAAPSSGTDAKPAAPAAAPAPADQKELAHTGSSTTNAVMGAGAGALILAGAGTVYAVRRRQQH